MRVKQIGNITKPRKNFDNPSDGRVYCPSGISPSINTCGGGNREPMILEKICQLPRGNNKGGTHEICPTITSNSFQENNYVASVKRVRKLTPRECGRLMSFPETDIDKMLETVSNSQAYKICGNSIVVEVLKAIFTNLNIHTQEKERDESRTNRY